MDQSPPVTISRTRPSPPPELRDVRVAHRVDGERHRLVELGTGAGSAVAAVALLSGSCDGRDHARRRIHTLEDVVLLPRDVDDR
jgi:hypothetical protein